MSKRLPYRKRDKEATMDRLIEAVGSILKAKGYAGIGVNKVALEAGVSKPMIYDHFDGLTNLLKAYIRKKDYWLPVFEQLRLPDPRNETDMMRFFSEVLQEQFRFFMDEVEMQKLILWQISEVNPLMRSISETREAEGAKLLKLAEPHFRGTDISFKTVTAILVGGIYYVILHAASNKSTVCGIDVNNERDREQFLKTIEQIIEWAWHAADKTKENSK